MTVRAGASSAAVSRVKAGDVEATTIAKIDQGASTIAVVISCSGRRSTAHATARPAKKAIQLARLYVK